MIQYAGFLEYPQSLGGMNMSKLNWFIDRLTYYLGRLAHDVLTVISGYDPREAWAAHERFLAEVEAAPELIKKAVRKNRAQQYLYEHRN